MWTDNMYTYTLDYNPDCVLTHHGTAVSTRTGGSPSALLRKKSMNFPPLSLVHWEWGHAVGGRRSRRQRRWFVLTALPSSSSACWSPIFGTAAARLQLSGDRRGVFIFFPNLLLADCLFEDNHLLFPWLMTCVSDVNSYKCALPAPRGVLPRS